MLKEKNLILFLCFPFLLLACVKEQVQEEEVQGQSLPVELESRLYKMLTYEVNPEAFPRSMEDETIVRGVPSRDWTSGFLPGSLYYAYRLTENPEYLAQAKRWTALIEQEKYNAKTHDMGFKVYSSFGNGYKITNDAHYKDVIIHSTNTLATRYNSTVGAIKSWDFGADRWTFPVIIDNMMNLELMFETAILTGNNSYYDMAYSHAERTLENHFRDDNSSYHVVDYDPNTGEIIKKLTHQGISDESSWARGQAWGLYGFTMAYRYTQDEKFLEQANDVYDFLFQHPNIPEDKIFYWDFDDPTIPDGPRDASAAAIVASALFELYEYTNNDEHLASAKAIMASLSSPAYMLSEAHTGPFILDHSTGNMPAKDEIDVPISYGDYYYLEALWRQKELSEK